MNAPRVVRGNENRGYICASLSRPNERSIPNLRATWNCIALSSYSAVLIRNLRALRRVLVASFFLFSPPSYSSSTFLAREYLRERRNRRGRPIATLLQFAVMITRAAYSRWQAELGNYTLRWCCVHEKNNARAARYYIGSNR